MMSSGSMAAYRAAVPQEPDDEPHGMGPLACSRCGAFVSTRMEDGITWSRECFPEYFCRDLARYAETRVTMEEQDEVRWWARPTCKRCGATNGYAERATGRKRIVVWDGTGVELRVVTAAEWEMMKAGLIQLGDDGVPYPENRDDDWRCFP